jgi:hypothetical protein
MRITLSHGGLVDIGAALEAPMSAASLWNRVGQFTYFTTLDPFHASVEIVDAAAGAGATLRITHRFGLFEVRRTGRILRWREGEGYSFSDLSQRGRRVGFPHIFTYRIEPLSPDSSRLRVRCIGRWTARFLPRWMIRAWIWWIMQRLLNAIRDELLASAIASRATAPSPGRQA